MVVSTELHYGYFIQKGGRDSRLAVLILYRQTNRQKEAQTVTESHDRSRPLLLQQRLSFSLSLSLASTSQCVLVHGVPKNCFTLLTCDAEVRVHMSGWAGTVEECGRGCGGDEYGRMQEGGAVEECGRGCGGVWAGGRGCGGVWAGGRICILCLRESSKRYRGHLRDG